MVNVIAEDIFVWLFVYLDFIWIKAFYNDYVIGKVVRIIFDINLFYLTHIHLYTNMTISMVYDNNPLFI